MQRTFDIQEQRKEIFERDDYICICGNSIFTYGTPQLGHRIPQKKYELEYYGKEIIHHPCNMVSCCSLKCNSRVSVAQNREGILQVLKDIRKYEEERWNLYMIDKVNTLIADLL